MPNTYYLPELLAPVGNMEVLQTAITYKADAVYLGGPGLSLRAQSRGFSGKDLQKAVDLAQKRGVKVYYCLNILARESELHKARQCMYQLQDVPIQGLIVADPGIISLAAQILPQIPIHLSTQANTSNSAAVKFWQDQGVSRVNLARELNCRDIRAIRQTVSDMELEIFVHGAMCMAISGRCLMSSHLTARSANLGLCTHPCRYAYRAVSVSLEEEKRPGRITWEIEQEDDFLNILAAQDLCLVKYLPWFCKLNINALKIEGRMKTSSYLAQVLDVYRTALNDLQENNFRPALYHQELAGTATRTLSSGFFLPGKQKTLVQPLADYKRPVILAKILDKEHSGKWKISIRHKWKTEKKVQILVPGLKRPLLDCSEYSFENESGEKLEVVHSGTQCWLRSENPYLQEGLFIRSS